MIDCPTPSKSRFVTKAEAKQRLRQRRHLDKIRVEGAGKLRPYRCVCGFYHLGHLPARIVQGLVTRRQVFGRR